MSRKIRTYKDLEKEEQLLEGLLKAQKELIELDIAQIKKQLKPAHMALQFFNKITTVEKGNILLNEGANNVIDFVLKKFVLPRAGWVTKMLVPMFVKNYSSHFIADHKGDLIDKIFSLFRSKDGKQKAA